MREALADCPWNSEVIDEARFTMGYFAAHSSQQTNVAKKSYSRQLIGIAASIAVILAIGIPVLSHKWVEAEPQCIAYVNGKVIENDQEAIMSLIAPDLNTLEMATREMDDEIANDMYDISEGTSIMTEELSSLGEAIELDE